MKELTKEALTQKIEEFIDNAKLEDWMLDEISMDVYIVHGVFPRFDKMCGETIRTLVSTLMSEDNIMDFIMSTIKDATANINDADAYINNASNTFEGLVNEFTSKPNELKFECVCKISENTFKDVVRYFISDNVNQ